MHHKTIKTVLGGLILFIGILTLSFYCFDFKVSIASMTKTSGIQQFTKIEALAIRLAPYRDLRTSLDSLVSVHQIEAGCILSCVGSLRQAAIRFANQPEATIFKRKFEIVSLSGTLSKHGSHLHLAISDSMGQTIGGHLMEGCLIYTTAEIVIGVLPDLRFLREQDQASGYRELAIYRR